MPGRPSNSVILLTGTVIAALLYLSFKTLKRCKAPSYVLRNGSLEVHISAMGGIIQRLLVPDRKGKVADIVLGHDILDDYLAFNQYFGAVIGRVANRTAYGAFEVDGQTVKLKKNDGNHHLHGGVKGWDKAIWQAEEFQHQEGTAVKLTYLSPDGEEGYPGNVEASITYILQSGGSLRTIFEATTDKTTTINMAQHSYFNLAGHSSGGILEHKILINGKHYTPKNSEGIPTGKIVQVEGTAFDFTRAEVVGKRIEEVEGGYDHNYVLFGRGSEAKASTSVGVASSQVRMAAELEDPESGRTMRVLTTAPGLQFYTGNFIENVKGKAGATYQKHAGLCLETQGFPNAANEEAFPSILLHPGEKYYHEVIYHFSTN